MMEIHDGLCFDDILLVPRYSEITSRSQVETKVSLPKEFNFTHPVIPANMKTITDKKMAKCIAETGGLAIVHRFMPLDDQLDTLHDFILMTSEGTPNYVRHVGFSVGVKKEDYENVGALAELGAKILCIDIAHGDSKMCLDMCQYISSKFPDLLLIAGNVSTAEGAKRLWDAGADVVKVGIGPGSLCSTRIETGNGVPQLTALMNVARCRDAYSATSKRRVGMIADGGIKNSGDIVKSLCFADMVMAGNLFAGTEETPGRIIKIEDRLYKEYVGSSTHKTNYIEGVSAMVPLKGKAKDVLTKLLEGVRSGVSYQGCSDLDELKDNPEFIRITNAGLRESHPHDVIINTLRSE
jgi:IMP dehydrogenase